MAGASSSSSGDPSSSKDIDVKNRAPKTLAQKLADKDTSAKLKRSLEWLEVRIPENTKKSGLQALYIQTKLGINEMNNDDYEVLEAFCRESSGTLTKELAYRELPTDGTIFVKLERLVRDVFEDLIEKEEEQEEEEAETSEIEDEVEVLEKAKEKAKEKSKGKGKEKAKEQEDEAEILAKEDEVEAIEDAKKKGKGKGKEEAKEKEKEEPISKVKPAAKKKAASKK